VPHHHAPFQSEGIGEYLRKPMSRSTMLRGVAGGLVMSMTGGYLAQRFIGPLLNDAPRLVLIVLDGARPDYFSLPGLTNVQSLMRSGAQYTNAFAGLLESETPAGHTAIGTGSEPSRNGILSFAWANDANVRVSIFDPAKIQNGMMEGIIRDSGVPTLAGQVRAARSTSAVVALSGSKYYAADAIGGPDANVIMYFHGTPDGQFVPTYVNGHAPPAGLVTDPALVTKSHNMPPGLENHLAMRLAANTFDRMGQQVTLINLPEFDWPLGHVDGGPMAPQRVSTLMHRFDQDLAMLQDTYRRAGVLDRTIFVLMADHGMMPLAHEVSAGDLTDAVTRAGTGIVSESFTTGTYLWIEDSSRALAAAQNILALNSPHIQSVYVKVQGTSGYGYQRVGAAPLLTTAAARAANQYLLRTFTGSNGPDVAVLFTEGVGSEPGGQASWKGDHGGASWEAQHIPLIISGPGVAAGRVSASPARLIDVAPTALQLMGMYQGGMQGIVLADAMSSPPSGARMRQAALNRQLLPLVAGMQQQSRTELALAS
jgi:arylsulfatase A-like enzyme